MYSVRLFGTLVCCALISKPASADPSHHNSVLVGGRALGMAGAATGIAEDASSVFYNPAGIAQLRRSKLSASFQLNAIDTATIRGGLREVEQRNLLHKDQPSLAVYVSAILKFGKKDKEGFRRHAVALSTIHPDQRHLQFSASSQLNTDFANLSFASKDDTLWQGLTYAYSASSDLAVGLSAFWSHRRYSHREAWTLAESVVQQQFTTATGTENRAFGAEALGVDVREVELNADHLVLRLGARHDLTQNWRLGWMLQPPGFKLGSTTASVFQYRLGYNLNTESPPFPTFYQGQTQVQAASPIPWELRLGSGFVDGDFSVGLDVLFHGPTGSALAPIVAVEQPSPDDYFGEAPKLPFAMAQRYYTNLTANVAIGAEGILGGVVPWAAGFFTDLSAAPEIVGPADEYALPHVNRYGFTGSLGWRHEGYDLHIGGALILGKGETLVLAKQTGEGSVYTPSTWKERTIVFFFSGHKKIISDLEKFASKTLKLE